MSTIFLIRHGESQSNAGLPTSSPDVVELTDRGWKQAEDITRLFEEAQIHPDLIVTSSYKRTKQTAAPTTLAFPNALEEEWSVEEFTYLSSWHQELSTMTERRPMVEVYWDIANPTLVDKAGSESFKQFIVRVQKVIKRLKQTRLETIAMFSHEQFICALLWLLQREQFTGKPGKDDMRKYRNFQLSLKIPNGAIVRLDLSDKQEWRQHEMKTSHLKELIKVPAGR